MKGVLTMIQSAYEDYRRELVCHKKMTVSAVIKKYFPSNDDLPFFALDVEVNISPKSDEDVEKNIISTLYKSNDFDTILDYYNNLQMTV
jgi:hypothetical protein